MVGKCNRSCKEDEYKDMIRVLEAKLKTKDDEIKIKNDEIKMKDEQLNLEKREKEIKDDIIRKQVEQVNKAIEEKEDIEKKYRVCQHMQNPKFMIKCLECTDDR